MNNKVTIISIALLVIASSLSVAAHAMQSQFDPYSAEEIKRAGGIEGASKARHIKNRLIAKKETSPLVQDQAELNRKVQSPLFTVTNSTGQPLDHVSFTFHCSDNAPCGQYKKFLEVGALADGSSVTKKWSDLGDEYSSAKAIFKDLVHVRMTNLFIITMNGGPQYNWDLNSYSLGSKLMIIQDAGELKLIPAR